MKYIIITPVLKCIIEKSEEGPLHPIECFDSVDPLISLAYHEDFAFLSNKLLLIHSTWNEQIRGKIPDKLSFFSEHLHAEATLVPTKDYNSILE